MLNSSTTLIFTVTFLCIPLRLFASEIDEIEDLPLQELLEPVSTASKFLQRQVDTPSAVSVVTREDIKHYGFRTLDEILRSLRGVYITNDRNYAYFGVRGFGVAGDYNSRVLLLVNGQRLNEAIFDSALLGFAFPVDVELIDRVEFVRGPSSSIYGNNAFFGVINVITRKGVKIAGTEVAAELGGYNSNQGRISYGDLLFDAVDVVLSATYGKSDGQPFLFYTEFNDPTTNNGIASHLDGESYSQIFAQATYKDFELQGGFDSRYKDIPTAAYGTVFNDSRFWTRDTQGFINLKYDHKLKDLDAKFLATVYYNYYVYTADYPFASETDPSDIVLNHDKSEAHSWGFELQFSKVFLGKHTLLTGVEFIDRFTQDQANYDIEPYFSYLDLQNSTRILGTFLQIEIKPIKQLIFNTGLRYDYYFDGFGGTLNPRASLVYNPIDGLYLKFIYGTAFRGANAYERFYQTSTPPWLPNNSLRPEKIQTYEIVAEQFLGKHLSFLLSGYYNRINNLIKLTGGDTEPFQFRNLGEIEAFGVESGSIFKYSKLEGRLSYAWQNTRDQQTKVTIANSPTHLAKFSLTHPLLPKLNISAEGEYMSSRKTSGGTGLADAHFFVNFALLSRDLLKGLTLSFSIKNLTNTAYYDPASEEHLQNTIRQDQRTLWLKAIYAFQ